MTTSDAEEWQLAIDFGTSNTTAVVRIHGRNRIVSFDEGAVSMPSGVLALDDGFRTGSVAQNQWRLAPDRFERNPKRLIGLGAVRLGETDYSPGDLVAAVLGEVRTRAAALAGARRLTGVALTHPEAWAPSQVRGLLHAAIAAGFPEEVIELVSEPIAAAFRYDADRGARADDGGVVVFDFGGGTCDVAILEPSTNGAAYTVVASLGDAALGGIDFDRGLFDWVLHDLTARGHASVVDRVQSPQGLGARLTLLASVERAKWDLSTHGSAMIPVSIGDVDLAITVTRTEYEALIVVGVQRAATLLRDALARAGMQQGEAARLYLTGGSAQTPAIIRAVQQTTGIAASPFENPKLVVAEGGLLALDRPKAPAPVVTSAPTLEFPTLEFPPPKVPPPQVPQVPESVPPPDVPRRPEGLRDSGTTTPSPRRSRRGLWIAGIAAASVLVLGGGGIAAAVGLGSLAGPTATPSTSTVTPTPTPSITTTSCWDGRTVSDPFPCPALSGLPALQWAFDDSAHPFDRCVAVPLDAVIATEPTAWGRDEAMCSWNDLPHTLVYLYRFDTTSHASAEISTDATTDIATPDTGNDLVGSGNEVFGTYWTGAGTDENLSSAYSQDSTLETFDLYSAIPFADWIVTDTSAGGTQADDKSANTRLSYRYASDISAVQATFSR